MCCHDSSLVASNFCMLQVPEFEPLSWRVFFFVWFLSRFGGLQGQEGSSLAQNRNFSAPFSTNGTYITTFSKIFWYSCTRWQVTDSYGTRSKLMLKSILLHNKNEKFQFFKNLSFNFKNFLTSYCTHANWPKNQCRTHLTFFHDYKPLGERCVPVTFRLHNI